jgi:hypothetical protein
MSVSNSGRRAFLQAASWGGAGVLGTSAAALAAQSVGIKKADLPDLTIKEVKIYVTDLKNIHKLNSTETGELISVVTQGGIEGNYTIGDRNHTEGWLQWAKGTLLGPPLAAPRSPARG